MGALSKNLSVLLLETNRFLLQNCSESGEKRYGWEELGRTYWINIYSYSQSWALMGWTWKEEKRTLNNTMFLQYASLHDISSVPVTCRNNLGWVWDILNNKDTIKGEWAEYSQLPNNWSFCSLRYSRTWNCHCVELLLKAEFLSVFDLASENLFVLERRKIGFQLTVVSVVWRHSSSIQRHCDKIFSQKSNNLTFHFLFQNQFKLLIVAERWGMWR